MSAPGEASVQATTSTSERRRGPASNQRHDSAGSGFEIDTDEAGEFVRQPTEFRDFVTREPGAKFEPARGRYHLYVSYACPWAHRTLIVRALKGLEAAVDVSVVHPLLDDRGWHFDDESSETRDQLYGSELLRERYDASVASGSYRGRVTVPVLWDRETRCIVNNESSEILRMFASEFDEFCEHPELDLRPVELRAEIDELNALIYPDVNNGVYRAGFATTQAAYERAYKEVFAALDGLEMRLGTRRYLTGPQLTEADIRLFTTLVRFDPVYHNHFKCNRRKLREYENLWGYTRDIAQLPGVMDTIRLDHIKQHYYQSHGSINPTGIVPAGPEYDLREPHGRERLGQ